MKKISSFILMTAVMVAALSSCASKNDYGIMGKQPTYLIFPEDGAFITPAYSTAPVAFEWRSLRHYCDYQFMFDKSADMANPATYPASVTWQRSSVKASVIDSVAAVLGFEPGAVCELYWKVQPVDPENGWCDEARMFYFERQPQITKQIMLDSPEPNYQFYVTKAYSQTLEFKWHCDKYITDYVLNLSTDKEFEENLMQVELGDATTYAMSERKVDDFLKAGGYGIGDKANLYWKVTGSGDDYIHVDESPRRTVKARRVANDPVLLKYVSPAPGAQTLASDGMTFEWQADTTVSFTLYLYEAEFGNTYSVSAGTKKSYAMDAATLSSTLSGSFGMVPGQRKKFQWWVEPSTSGSVYYEEEKREWIVTL